MCHVLRCHVFDRGVDDVIENKRYEFHCVAPEVYVGIAPTDDLDEALLATSTYHGSHWDIWDTVERKYIPPIESQEELDELKARMRAKGS
jgi:hypothetical protein